MGKCLYLVLMLTYLIGLGNAYQAEIEVQIEKFLTLNKDTIAEGKSCDSSHVGGGYNACDFVFYMEECRRYYSQNFDCKLSVNRFYAKENTDNVIFLDNETHPAMQIAIQNEFPKTLLLNVTVWDQDDGFSGDDYIGTYRLYFTPNQLSKSRLGRAGAETIEHVITIPDHSQLVLRYRAYCVDDECRSQSVPQQQLLFNPPPQNPQNLGFNPGFNPQPQQLQLQQPQQRPVNEFYP